MRLSHIVILLFSNIFTCFFTCLVHMPSMKNGKGRHWKPEIKAPATNLNETVNVRAFRYDRSLETGFGDRISVYLCVAAAAATVNRSVYVWWHECDQDSNHHAELCLNEVQRRITWPSNLHVLSRNDFYSKTQNLPDITYNTPGLLMSYQTFDGVYTTAWKTMRLPGDFPQLQKEHFETCYKDVCSQLRLKDTEQYKLPHVIYTVLHIRGGDKKTNTKEFKTVAVLQQMPRGTKILVITDDDAYASGILSEYSRNFSRNSSFYIQFLPTSRQNASKEEVLFRDFYILLQAEKIIQHSPSAWSAFSNTASMIRNIPLLNTWKSIHSNNEKFIGLMSTLHSQENCPREFFSANRADQVAKFLNTTSSRMQSISALQHTQSL